MPVDMVTLVGHKTDQGGEELIPIIELMEQWGETMG